MTVEIALCLVKPEGSYLCADDWFRSYPSSCCISSPTVFSSCYLQINDRIIADSTTSSISWLFRWGIPPGATTILWMRMLDVSPVHAYANGICVKPFVPKFEMVPSQQLLKTITEFTYCMILIANLSFFVLLQCCELLRRKDWELLWSSSECCIQGWIEAGALIVTTQNFERSQESARFDRFIGSCTESRCWTWKSRGQLAEETRLKRLFAGFYFRHVWSSEHVAKARFGLGHYLTSSWRRWLSSDIEMGVK
jgi:hypothetical protein